MTTNQASIGLPKRADIQALRALAIGLVVACHAHVPFLQGGYVGVDVFFVLSGYLISGLILVEVERYRTFDAIRFYTRRVKRLLPALLTMLLTVAWLSWLLLGPQRQGADAQAGQAATLWLSNFYFATRVINYFSVGSAGNIFLHTWSLAVEEQFYLLWPWLMLFLFGIWRWQGSPFSRKRLAVGMVVFAMLSLAVSAYLSQTNSEADFYLMPSRIWEFALGALTLLLRQGLSKNKGEAQWLQRWLGLSMLNGAGLLMIILAAVAYTNSLRYPGMWGLLPAIGTALMLLDMPENNVRSPLSRLLLKQPLLLFMGDISYSLYLWHWPLLILGVAIFGASPWVRFVAVMVSIGISTLAYFMIERPIHLAKFKHSLRVLLPSIIAMIVVFNIMGFWQKDIRQLLISPAQIRLQQAVLDMPKLYRVPGCDTWYHSAEVKACVFGSPKADHTVVMFGDSVLAQWFPTIAEIYLKRPNWRLIVLTKSACSATQVSYYYPAIKRIYKVCNIWRKRAIAYMAHLHPDVIFMGSTHYPFTAKQWISGTRAVLDRLSPASHAIVILSATPELGFNGLSCLSMRAHLPKWLHLEKHCSRALKPVTSHSVVSLLRRAATPFPNVHVIDMRREICPDQRCRAELDGRIVYRDGQHLTASFIRTLAPALKQILKADSAPS